MVVKHLSDPGTISASQVQPGAIIQISATSPSPTMAARQANAWAAAYVTYRRSLAENEALGSTAVIQQQIDSLQKQIAALNYQIALEGPLSSSAATDVAFRNALLGQQVRSRASSNKPNKRLHPTRSCRPW